MKFNTKMAFVFGLASLFFFECASQSEQRVYEDASAPIQPLSVDASIDAVAEDVQKTPCPETAVHLKGSMCVEARHTCVEWIDDASLPYARCARFSQPAKCVRDKRRDVDVCIDRFERADVNGIPFGDVSWENAALACERAGMRLCNEFEWVFACEGEEMRPYPHGWERRPDLCNYDILEGLVCGSKPGDLCDHRLEVEGERTARCRTPEGVVNLVGNIDEWVVLDRPHMSKNTHRQQNSGLKGGWWGPMRNRCRPTTVEHDEKFHELQTGYRCCSDPKL